MLLTNNPIKLDLILNHRYYKYYFKQDLKYCIYVSQGSHRSPKVLNVLEFDFFKHP